MQRHTQNISSFRPLQHQFERRCGVAQQNCITIPRGISGNDLPKVMFTIISFVESQGAPISGSVQHRYLSGTLNSCSYLKQHNELWILCILAGGGETQLRKVIDTTLQVLIYISKVPAISFILNKDAYVIVDRRPNKVNYRHQIICMYNPLSNRMQIGSTQRQLFSRTYGYVGDLGRGI